MSHREGKNVRIPNGGRPGHDEGPRWEDRDSGLYSPHAVRAEFLAHLSMADGEQVDPADREVPDEPTQRA